MLMGRDKKEGGDGKVEGGAIELETVQKETNTPAEQDNAPLSVAALANGSDSANTEVVSESADYITVEELRRMWDAGVSVIVLDVRTERTFEESDSLAKDAIRLHPDSAVLEARRMGLPRDAHLALFCT